MGGRSNAIRKEKVLGMTCVGKHFLFEFRCNTMNRSNEKRKKVLGMTCVGKRFLFEFRWMPPTGR